MFAKYLICLSLAFAITPSYALDLNELAGSLTQQASTNNTLQQFSNKDQISGLKQALTQGAEMAVKTLAEENGYLANDKVRIPLPENLQKLASLMRKFGMGKQADELTTSMNRAAEAAVPEAKVLLVNAVKKMTVQDAKNILLGEPNAATQYFRQQTEGALTDKFKPIVTKSMQKVKLAQTYDAFAAKGSKYGLVDEKDAKLNDYITRKALDGLFVMMAEQEKAIRDNPMQAAGSLAQKIFSAVKK